jgi:plasmid stabilization system protein ParE
VDTTLSSVARNPKIFQVIYKNIRRAILRRFPYCLFFIKGDEHIQVLAVFHAHRDPTEWKNRK